MGHVSQSSNREIIRPMSAIQQGTLRHSVVFFFFLVASRKNEKLRIYVLFCCLFHNVKGKCSLHINNVFIETCPAGALTLPGTGGGGLMQPPPKVFLRWPKKKRRRAAPPNLAQLMGHPLRIF